MPVPSGHTVHIAVVEWPGTKAFVKLELRGSLHMKSRKTTLCAIGIIVAGIPAAWESVAVAQTEPLNCDDWNTLDFFEVATADDVMACLATGADVHARNDGGETLLHAAMVVNPNPAIREALLDAGADVHVQAAGDGPTPLHYTAFFNEDPIVEFLIANGADVNARTDDGSIRLHDAARNNSSPLIVEMLVAAATEVCAQDDSGRTSLHFAARYSGNIDVIHAPIDADADPNAQNILGEFPLLVAARDNDNFLAGCSLWGGLGDTEPLELIGLLVNAGAPWRYLEAVELATLEWLEWFNHRRLFGPIGDLTPVEKEEIYYQNQEWAKVA